MGFEQNGQNESNMAILLKIIDLSVWNRGPITGTHAKITDDSKKRQNHQRVLKSSKTTNESRNVRNVKNVKNHYMRKGK